MNKQNGQTSSSKWKLTPCKKSLDCVDMMELSTILFVKLEVQPLTRNVEILQNSWIFSSGMYGAFFLCPNVFFFP